MEGSGKDQARESGWEITTTILERGGENPPDLGCDTADVGVGSLKTSK